MERQGVMLGPHLLQSGLDSIAEFHQDGGMTNGWDVLTDAIKIGVPSLLTGLVAYFVARSSRSHDFEKERRRRKRDCLERVLENLDECREAVHALVLTSVVFDQFRNDPVQFVACLEDANEQGDILDAAQRKFSQSSSKLLAFGFPDCKEKLDAYDSRVDKLKVVLDEVRQSKTGDVKARELMIALDLESGPALVDSIAKAFAQL